MGHYSTLIGIRPSQLENKFGKYVSEILFSEGITDFSFVDIDSDFHRLVNHPGIIILTRCHLKFAEIDKFVSFIRNGGRAIIIQPSNYLAEALGLEVKKRVSLQPYILSDENHPVSKSLVRKTIQCHVPVEQFDYGNIKQNMEIIAHTYKDRRIPQGYPAIVSYSLGKGKLGLFLYDLPKSVARIRFGNTDLIGFPTLGHWQDIHSSDLFVAHVDEARADIPQADIHCMLFSNLLQYISPFPIARWWYYPECDQKSAIILRSDDDWSTPEQFETLREAVEKRNGHDTFFLVKDTRLPDSEVKRYLARGHSFGPHPNPYSKEEDPYFCTAEILTEDIIAFKKRYGRDVKTCQHHCGTWRGYMELIPTYVKNSVRMAVSYVSALNFFHTYMTGSSRPMRFVDQNGEIYDCYQQSNQSYDDGSVTDILTKNPELEIEKVRDNINNSLKYHYSPVGFSSHPVSFATYSRRFVEGVLDIAVRNNMPILSSDEWCDFTDLRNMTKLELTSISESEWQFQIGSTYKGKLTAMIPLRGKTKPNKVQIDGQDISYEIAEILGNIYIMLPVKTDSIGKTKRVKISVNTQ